MKFVNKKFIQLILATNILMTIAFFGIDIAHLMIAKPSFLNCMTIFNSFFILMYATKALLIKKENSNEKV